MLSSRALVLFSGLACFATPVRAQTVTHPLWASTPEAESDQAARAQFEGALQRRGLGPLEVVTLERPKDPRLAQRVADGMAASRAQGKGASYALLGQLRLGDKIEIDLRLIDARTQEVCDASAVVLADGVESPDLIAAVLRLDEVATRTVVTQRAAESGQPNARLPMVLPPTRAATDDHPPFSEGWLRHRWPLVTAVGVAVGTALALGIVVATDKSGSATR